MPVERAGFMLRPFGVLDTNPRLTWPRWWRRDRRHLSPQKQ